MATSTAQQLATVAVWDYLVPTGDPTLANPKALAGKKVKITLTYGLAQSASPVTLLSTEPVNLLTDPNGFFQANLVPNNKISPAGTLYTVEIEGYRSYLIQVTDVNAPVGGWQTAAIAVLPPVGGGAPGYTLPGGTEVLGNLVVDTELSAQDVKLSGLTGATAGTRWAGATAFGPPTTGVYIAGDWVISRATGIMFICTVSGSPGTWISASGTYSIVDYGAKVNAQQLANGAMGTGSAVLTSASNPFVATDVGKSIYVIGAGAAGVPLRTTILSFQSAGQVTLAVANASGAPLAAALFVWGQNDAQFVNAAITAANAAGGGTVTGPPGLCLIDTPGVILLSNVNFSMAGKSLSTYTGALSGANGILATNQVGTGKSVYTNITVQNLTVRSANGHATSFYNVSRLDVVNTEMYFSAGPVLIECLFVQHCQHVNVNSNYLHDFNGDGVQICSTDHFDVSNNLILGNASADDLIDVDRDFLDTGLIPSRYGTVSGNLCRHSIGSSQPGNGVRVEDSQWITVTGNTIDDIQNGNGVVVNSAVATITTKFIDVVGNTISACILNGIKVAPESTGGAFSNVNVTANVLDTCGQPGGADIRAGIQVGGVTTQAGGVLVQGNYLSACGKGDGNGAAIMLYKSGASNTQVIGNYITLTPSGALGGIAAWNGDAGQTYTNVKIVNNQMVANVAADYNSECTSQAGITLIFWSATAGETHVKPLTLKSTVNLDGSGVGAGVNWILMGPIANFTSGNFIQMQTSTSAFTGSGLLQNFANGSGTFTGNFLRSQVNSVDKHILTATGLAEHAAQIYPGAEALGVQTTGGLLHAVAVPTNGNGNNNDWCISDNGHLYFRRGGVWVDMTAAVTAQSTPGNPAGTASAPGVMMGLAGAITPLRTGNILVVLSGDIFNNTINDGGSVQLRHGTGTAPVNGAALTGTADGGKVQATAAVASEKAPFSVQAVIAGLTLGTAVWLDAAVAAITGGTASIENVSISAVEV